MLILKYNNLIQFIGNFLFIFQRRIQNVQRLNCKTTHYIPFFAIILPNLECPSGNLKGVEHPKKKLREVAKE